MKKKIAIDMLLNIVATAIPTIVLQLILLPAVSRFMTGNQYGLFITILALLNMIPSTFGNVLNNMRLIDGTNDTESTQYDFNVLLLVLTAINLVFMIVFTLIYDSHSSFFNLFLTLLISLVLLFREYYLVTFRIKLNFINIVLSNLIMVAGYGLGYLFFRLSEAWQYIYIFGYLFSLIFIFAKSDLWKEPLSIGPSFKHISIQTVLLTVATFLGRITTYADKLFIFPVLGGSVVSVYYTATLFGKVISMAINPISSVMLSYLSKASKKSDNTFNLVFFSSGIVSIFGYLICLGISRPVLQVLYPQFVDDAMQYIYLTTGTMVLTSLISIVNPFVLKFFDMKWQIIINSIYVAVYIGISMILLHSLGLKGFCLGTLIASTLKLLCTIYIYYRGYEKLDNNGGVL